MLPEGFPASPRGDGKERPENHVFDLWTGWRGGQFNTLWEWSQASLGKGHHLTGFLRPRLWPDNLKITGGPGPLRQ